MKPFVLLVVIGAALAAPLDEKTHEATNGPCVGAPVALYLAGSVPGKTENNREVRSYYDGPGAAIGGAGVALSGAALSGAAASGLSLAAAASAGPAVGVFPNAKIGGCAIPLLLSCAPSVHTGHIAAAAPAYRADEHKRESTFESQWDESMRASDNQWEAAHKQPSAKSQWEAKQNMRETLDNKWEGEHKMQTTGKSQWTAHQEMRESTNQNQLEHEAMKPHHHHVLAIDLHHNHE